MTSSRRPWTERRAHERRGPSAYLLQRSTLPPRFPDSLSVIEYDESTGGFRQHYVDSRGATWTLDVGLRLERRP